MRPPRRRRGRKLRHDLYYLKNCSAILDLRIDTKTFHTIVIRPGAGCSVGQG